MGGVPAAPHSPPPFAQICSFRSTDVARVLVGRAGIVRDGISAATANRHFSLLRAGHASATPPASSTVPLQPLPTGHLATRPPATFAMPSVRVSWPRVGKEMPIPYLSPQVSEGLIQERVNATIRRNASVVQAAEEGTSAWQRLLDRTLHAARVAPPYMRFLPLLLRMPRLVLLRRAFPSIRATNTTGTVVVPEAAPAETRSAPPDAAPA